MLGKITMQRPTTADLLWATTMPRSLGLGPLLTPHGVWNCKRVVKTKNTRSKTFPCVPLVRAFERERARGKSRAPPPWVFFRSERHSARMDVRACFHLAGCLSPAVFVVPFLPPRCCSNQKR